MRNPKSILPDPAAKSGGDAKKAIRGKQQSATAQEVSRIAHALAALTRS
jgi:hypothetical protein